MIRSTLTRPGRGAARRLAAAAGVRGAPIGWRFVEGPYFDNQAGTLVFDGSSATALLDKTVAVDGEGRLERVYQRELTPV
jgi:hypothetical protein